MDKILSNQNYLDLIRQNGTVLFIDEEPIINNYNLLKKQVKEETEIIPVVKNNAYQLGIENIVPILQKIGLNSFFVATLQEAIKLRNLIGKNGKIFVLNGVFENQEILFAKNNLIPSLNTISQIKLWNNFAIKNQQKFECLLHIETGFQRFCLSEEEIDILEKQQQLISNLNILYYISHFACSDIENHPSIKQQSSKFYELVKKLPPAKLSISASSGVFLKEDDYILDMVRPGLILYGGNPIPYQNNISSSAVFLYSCIKQIKHLQKGEKVGYAHTWEATKETDIAIIPIGYADGIKRSLQNNGAFYISNHKCPIIGRISMDYTVIDITDIPNHLKEENQIVAILDGVNNTIDSLASAADTIPCELLNIMTSRYPKYIIKKELY